MPGFFSPIDIAIDDIIPKVTAAKTPKVVKAKVTAAKNKIPKAKATKAVVPKAVPPKKLKQKITPEYLVLIEKIKAIPVNNRPQKVKALINVINTFSPIKQGEKIIPILEMQGIIKLQNTKVVYTF